MNVCKNTLELIDKSNQLWELYKETVHEFARAPIKELEALHARMHKINNDWSRARDAARIALANEFGLF
jgi:hypothetical protein